MYAFSLCYLLSLYPAFHPFWLPRYLIPPVIEIIIILPLKVERRPYLAFRVMFYQKKKKGDEAQVTLNVPEWNISLLQKQSRENYT